MPTSRRYTDATAPTPAPAARPAARARARTTTTAAPPSTRSTFGVRSFFRRIRGVSAAPAPVAAPATAPADPGYFAHVITAAEFSRILKSYGTPFASSEKKPLTDEQFTSIFTAAPGIDLDILRSFMDKDLANMDTPGHSWYREKALAAGKHFLPLGVWFKMYCAVNVQVARANWGWEERMAIKLIFTRERAEIYNKHYALESYTRSVSGIAPWKTDAKKLAVAETEIRKMEETHIAQVPAFKGYSPDASDSMFKREYVRMLRTLSNV